VSQHRKPHQTYRVIEGDTERNVRTVGRDTWMLDRLLAAGIGGCTAQEVAGAATTQYVFSLRKKYGLNIETIMEPHDGPFKGRHGRYVLQSKVQRIDIPAEASAIG
jgi:hypothetical protein